MINAYDVTYVVELLRLFRGQQHGSRGHGDITHACMAIRFSCCFVAIDETRWHRVLAK